jgi:hypothetical protein
MEEGGLPALETRENLLAAHGKGSAPVGELVSRVKEPWPRG